MKIKSYTHDPRLGRLHQGMTAPDAKQARRTGLVDKGTPPPGSDREFGLTSTEVLKGIGHSTATKLERLGIVTVSQLAHSDRDLSPLGAQAQTVLDVRTKLQSTLTHKERARRDQLATLRAVGDLPRLPVDKYRQAIREDLLSSWPFASEQPDAATLDKALNDPLNEPSVQRRTYLPDGETAVRAFVADFDLAALGGRVRCVHEGNDSFRVWTDL